MSPTQMRDQPGSEAWHRWRLELAAYGQYVELSFENVELRTDEDVDHWARELALALGHYRRPVDLLLDLRGMHVGARCGTRCGTRLLGLLRRHAVAVAHHGADAWTLAAFEPALAAFGAVATGRDRERARARLMELREHRQGCPPAAADGPSVSISPAQSRTWARSKSTHA